jgi:hypothetical protein
MKSDLLGIAAASLRFKPEKMRAEGKSTGQEIDLSHGEMKSSRPNTQYLKIRNGDFKPVSLAIS